MNATQLLKERRSIREFTSEKVEKEKLEKIVDLARFAPTANNVQPWEMVAVTDEEKLDRLSELIDQGKEFPACIVVFVEKVKHNVKDASCLSTYLNLAASAEGLGSCWVNAYEKEYEDEVYQLLNVPSEYKLFSIMTIGHPDEDPEPEKRDVEDLLHWEQF